MRRAFFYLLRSGTFGADALDEVMMMLMLFGALQQPLTADAVVLPSSSTISVSAVCPQGAVRIVATTHPDRMKRRVGELSLGGRRLPREQVALIDQAIGSALIDAIHIQECASSPDDRIRVQIRVERVTGPVETVRDLITFFVKDEAISFARLPPGDSATPIEAK